MHRGPNEGKKILSTKWNEYNKQIHYKKLKTIKGQVDSTCPSTYGVLRKKPKKEQLAEDRFTEIERENRILLEKMSHIVNSRGNRSSSTNRRKSLNNEARKRQNLQIIVENQALLKRLQDKQPSYSVYRWEEERRNTEKRLKNISEFPYTLSSLDEASLRKGSECRTRQSSRSRRIIKIAESPIRNPRKLSPINKRKSVTMFKKGMNVGDKHFIVEIQKKEDLVTILAYDVESPESFCLEMAYAEAVDLMGGKEAYQKLAGMLGMEDGDLILIDTRQQYEDAAQSNKSIRERKGYHSKQFEDEDLVVESENVFHRKTNSLSGMVSNTADDREEFRMTQPVFVEKNEGEDEYSDYDQEEEGDNEIEGNSEGEKQSSRGKASEKSLEKDKEKEEGEGEFSENEKLEKQNSEKKIKSSEKSLHSQGKERDSKKELRSYGNMEEKKSETASKKSLQQSEKYEEDRFVSKHSSKSFISQTDRKSSEKHPEKSESQYLEEAVEVNDDEYGKEFFDEGEASNRSEKSLKRIGLGHQESEKSLEKNIGHDSVERIPQRLDSEKSLKKSNSKSSRNEGNEAYVEDSRIISEPSKKSIKQDSPLESKASSRKAIEKIESSDDQDLNEVVHDQDFHEEKVEGDYGINNKGSIGSKKSLVKSSKHTSKVSIEENPDPEYLDEEKHSYKAEENSEIIPSADADIEDSNPEDHQIEDPYPEDHQIEDSHPEDHQIEDSYPEDHQIEDSYPEDHQIEHPYPEDHQSEDPEHISNHSSKKSIKEITDHGILDEAKAQPVVEQPEKTKTQSKMPSEAPSKQSSKASLAKEKANIEEIRHEKTEFPKVSSNMSSKKSIHLEEKLAEEVKLNQVFREHAESNRSFHLQEENIEEATIYEHQEPAYSQKSSKQSLHLQNREISRREAEEEGDSSKRSSKKSLHVKEESGAFKHEAAEDAKSNLSSKKSLQIKKVEEPEENVNNNLIEDVKTNLSSKKSLHIEKDAESEENVYNEPHESGKSSKESLHEQVIDNLESSYVNDLEESKISSIKNSHPESEKIKEESHEIQVDEEVRISSKASSKKSLHIQNKDIEEEGNDIQEPEESKVSSKVTSRKSLHAIESSHEIQVAEEPRISSKASSKKSLQVTEKIEENFPEEIVHRDEDEHHSSGSSKKFLGLEPEVHEKASHELKKPENSEKSSRKSIKEKDELSKEIPSAGISENHEEHQDRIESQQSSKKSLSIKEENLKVKTSEKSLQSNKDPIENPQKFTEENPEEEFNEYSKVREETKIDEDKHVESSKHSSEKNFSLENPDVPRAGSKKSLISSRKSSKKSYGDTFSKEALFTPPLSVHESKHNLEEPNPSDDINQPTEKIHLPETPQHLAHDLSNLPAPEEATELEIPSHQTGPAVPESNLRDTSEAPSPADIEESQEHHLAYKTGVDEEPYQDAEPAHPVEVVTIHGADHKEAHEGQDLENASEDHSLHRQLGEEVHDLQDHKGVPDPSGLEHGLDVAHDFPEDQEFREVENLEEASGKYEPQEVHEEHHEDSYLEENEARNVRKAVENCEETGYDSGEKVHEIDNEGDLEERKDEGDVHKDLDEYQECDAEQDMHDAHTVHDLHHPGHEIEPSLIDRDCEGGIEPHIN